MDVGFLPLSFFWILDWWCKSSAAQVAIKAKLAELFILDAEWVIYDDELKAIQSLIMYNKKTPISKGF